MKVMVFYIGVTTHILYEKYRVGIGLQDYVWPHKKKLKIYDITGKLRFATWNKTEIHQMKMISKLFIWKGLHFQPLPTEGKTIVTVN